MNTYKNMFSVLAVAAGLVAGINTQAFAQSPTGGASNLCLGDSICLEAPGARGTVTWFASTNSGPYDTIGTGALYCTTPPLGNHLVYGMIVEGTCAPVYTDTLNAIVSDGPVLTSSTNSLLLTDCLGFIPDLTAALGLSASGPGPFGFTWTALPGISNTASSNPSLTGQGAAGTFPAVVTIIDFSTGCSSDLAFDLVIDPQGVTSFNFTGGIQTFSVPSCVDTIFVQAWGGQGGNGDLGGAAVAGGAGGLGGYAEGFLVVNPGDVINVFVGGQGATPTGGFNGGANGGTTNAGGGGGASDVRVGGTAEANRVLVAGGGGGGGRGGCDEGSASTGGIGGSGGAGGSGVGSNGGDSPTSGGVAGGGKGGNFASVQGAGGAKGIGCASFSGTDGNTASTGTGATGGSGQSCCCSQSNSTPGGGGGGGGFLGGGGGGGGSAGTSACQGNSKGAGGGGGGGSNYTGGVLNGATNTGIWLGNGQVTISW